MRCVASAMQILCHCTASYPFHVDQLLRRHESVRRDTFLLYSSLECTHPWPYIHFILTSSSLKSPVFKRTHTPPFNPGHNGDVLLGLLIVCLQQLHFPNCPCKHMLLLCELDPTCVYPLVHPLMGCDERRCEPDPDLCYEAQVVDLLEVGVPGTQSEQLLSCTRLLVSRVLTAEC